MLLNRFPVTDLRPEVELMHLLRMRRHYCHVMFETHGIGQTMSSLERYLVVEIIIRHTIACTSVGDDLLALL